MAHGIDLKRLSTPGNPASTHDRLYNDANGTLYFRDSNGVQNQISPASGGFTSFTMSDGSNNQTINSGNTQTFTGGVAINGTVAATDTLTLNWNLTKLSSANGTLHRDDYIGLYDLSGVAHQRTALSDLPISTSVDTSNDYVPVIKNSNGLVYRVAPTNLGSGTTVQYAILRDEKTTGTSGGSSSAATWNNRNLNTEVSDTGSIVTISSNQFTPIAGDYILQATAPAFQAGLHRLRLYNVTGAASVDEGPTARSASVDTVQTLAILTTRFTANGTDAYRIDHYTSGAIATTGLGNAVSDGSAEVYLEMLLKRVA